MKIKGKRIAFGLTNAFYTFKKTIEEMKNIVSEGGEIIPIMDFDTYSTNSKYGKTIDFIKNIETITNRKIITSEEVAEEIEADIMVIAPCYRKSYCKTCNFNI